MNFKAGWLNYETGTLKNSESAYGNPSPYFRKTFVLRSEVKRANLSFTAFGVVKAYINGKPVGNDYLSPGFSDYRKRLPVIKRDVTALLEKENAIGLVAGDGWAVGYVGNAMKRCNYSRRIFVAAQLDIEYVNGEKERLITDKTWKAASGEILRSDIYMGEVIDKRFSLGDFSAYSYDDSKWSAPLLVRPWNFYRMTDMEREPEITVKHVLDGKLINSTRGKLIYDFGQNAAGVVTCVVKGARCAKITFRHGEMLTENGELYTENLRKAEQTDVFILSGGGEEIFRPLFTFHGFRYAEITIDGKADVRDVKAEIMYTDLEKTGEFSCSDELVNKLYSNIVWGQRSNFISIPTDCPQRDERVGWTGDAQIFCGSAMFNMDCKAFYEKYVLDIIDAQYGNGAVGGVAPTIPHYDCDSEEFDCIAAGWRDAIAVIPYTHYLFYGDKEILRTAVPCVKRLIGYLLSISDGYIQAGDDEYGDWLAVSVGNSECDTDKSLLSTLWFAYSTYLLSRICDIISDSDTEKYYDLYEQIKNAFRAKFIRRDGSLASDTQTSYLLSYAFGIMTKEEISERLERNIELADYHLTTGFLGVKFLLPVLCDIGRSDLAYVLLTEKTYPSWLYSVINGATTVWERWNGYTEKVGFADPGMNSFNHYSLGSCSEWLFRYCLGINPTEDGAGFKKILVRPFVDFSGKISHASGSYICAAGKISVKWEVKDENALYNISLPKGIKAEYDFSEYGRVEKLGEGAFILSRRSK